MRWTWRQLTSMRTALVLLLLLALAAIPGSVIPQYGVDALAVTRWKDQHPKLTPIYEKLDLFSVYDSVVVLRDLPAAGGVAGRLHHPAPVRLRRRCGRSRLRRRATCPGCPTTRRTRPTLPADEVLERARAVLGKRHRLRPTPAMRGDAVSAERGYLREAGNLLFHLSVLVVLAGFAIGGLFGYQGGVILVQGSTFGNNLTQYDDFDPGGLFTPEQLDEFSFTVEDFDVEWLRRGARAGTAHGFEAGLSYREGDGRGAASTTCRSTTRCASATPTCS